MCMTPAAVYAKYTPLYKYHAGYTAIFFKLSKRSGFNEAEYSSSTHAFAQCFIWIVTSSFLLGWCHGVMVSTADIQQNLSKKARLRRKIDVILLDKHTCLEV